MEALAVTVRTTPTALRTVTPRITRDGRRLRHLLALHAVRSPRIVDVTYGHGMFWRGLPYRPLRLDLRPLAGVDEVLDWRNLPRRFAPASFDVVVWDPIHVTDVGARSLMGQRYAAADNPVTGESISQLYPGFLSSARAVLEPETGVCIVKLADQVHSGRQQLAFVDFASAARADGWTVCDYDVAWRVSAMQDPKWTRELHVRKQWAFWVVLRLGAACHGPGGMRVRSCDGCGVIFRTRNRHARTCSGRCRQRIYRRTRSV